MRSLLGLLTLALALPASAQDRTPLPEGVPVVTRAAWGGGPPVAPMIPQTPSALTIHHSGTPMRPERAPAETLRALYSFSTRRDTLGDGTIKEPWPDIPYHFYVSPNGAILEARDVAFEGDTNTRYDLSDQVLVVVEGNFEVETPTDAQMESLLALSEALAHQWGFGAASVAGHRDHAPGQTVCPGDALEARFDDVRAAVERGARHALDGTWSFAHTRGELVLTVGPDGRVSGMVDGAPVAYGRVDATGDALHVAFAAPTDAGLDVAHARLHGGQLEGATLASDGTLTPWTAVRLD